MVVNKLIIFAGTHAVGKSSITQRVVNREPRLRLVSDTELKVEAAKELGYGVIVNSVAEQKRVLKRTFEILRRRVASGHCCYDGHLVFDYISIDKTEGVCPSRLGFFIPEFAEIIPDAIILINASYLDSVRWRRQSRPWDSISLSDYEMELALNRYAIGEFAKQGSVVKEIWNSIGKLDDVVRDSLQVISLVLEGSQRSYLYNPDKLEREQP